AKNRLWKSEFPWLVDQCLRAAASVTQKSKEKVILVLDELNRTGASLAKEIDLHPEWLGQLYEEVRMLLRAGVWVLTERPTFEPFRLNYSSLVQPANFGRTFLSLAVKYRLTDYIAAKANRGCLVQRATIGYNKKVNFGHKSGVYYAIWPLL